MLNRGSTEVAEVKRLFFFQAEDGIRDTSDWSSDVCSSDLIAVWVGLIALLGLDAETGIFMLLYLDLAYDAMRPRSREELREAIYHGAVKRVRPKVMTDRKSVV